MYQPVAVDDRLPGLEVFQGQILAQVKGKKHADRCDQGNYQYDAVIFHGLQMSCRKRWLEWLVYPLSRLVGIDYKIFTISRVAVRCVEELRPIR